ncbi:hypothetical protein U91I_01699 [alpha proteobacterium U9-1i]|nr:hypothetical protein U91I_01699 [alpha proteobacterium U9-1i]
MGLLRAGASYFAIVFVVAFALGTVRTLWLEPALGEMWAVACETPLLVAAMFFAARWLVPRFNAPSPPRWLGVGLIGFALQQIAEIALVLASGETLAMHAAYLRTPAGMIYLSALAVFVMMPLLVWAFTRKR